MKKVCSINATWIVALMLIVPGSVVHAENPPSVQDQVIRDDQPALTAPVPPALRQALASSLDEAASVGVKAIPAPPTGSWGIVSEGDGGGGIFRDSDSEAEAWLGTNGYGVEGYGLNAGGYFKDSDQSGYAYVGYGDLGIQAMGHSAGAFIKDSNGTGYSYVGYGNRGIQAYGTEMGAHFADSDSSGVAYVAKGDFGIDARGTAAGGFFKDSGATGFAYVGNEDYGIYAFGALAGGYFKDSLASGYANVGYGDRGIEAYGTEMGGYFEDLNGSGNAYVGYADRGIEAYGNEMGGYFKDSDNSGYAYVGYANYGIQAYGNTAAAYFEDTSGTGRAYIGIADIGIDATGSYAGGYFKDDDGTGEAYAGYGDYGIQASGNLIGGYFFASNSSGFARVGVGDYGIRAYGNAAGGTFEDVDGTGFANLGVSGYGIQANGSFSAGYFNDSDSSSFAYVGYEDYKIYGSGTVSFVQNHPYDPGAVIVYAAPEGDEVATYTRGTAMLVDGEATVPLGETFKWVTNPDLGLTAFLTPVSEWCDLFVAEQATDSIVVRSRDGSDCGFNYMVYGLRIGFEESSIVQEKERESYIPSMASHRQLYERRPDLRSYNSLERFKSMHQAISPKAKLDLSRANALRDAIIEFDPAVHELPKPPGHEERPRDDLALEEAQRGEVQRVRAARVDHDRKTATDQSDLRAAIPVDADGNVYAPSFRPPSREVATLVNVSESVEPGDVLVIDRDTAGLMRRGFEGHDSGVVGVVLDSQSPALSGEEVEAETALHAEVAIAGVVKCKVDATYGAIWPGNLLVTSPTSGHAMRTESPLPGTIVGKALEPLEEGVGTIKVLVVLR